MRALSLSGVSLKYPIVFKENGRNISEEFWALKDIGLDINKGEIVGIIGENGAGKTSLLKIIVGMIKPDMGSVEVNGRISTLISIGSTFQMDSTGRENIYFIASLYGLTKIQVDSRYRVIVEFASLGRFINAPLKTYSQGMLMRLAFAIGVHVDSDILIVDDVFAVGDDYTQRKCLNKMFELKDSGKTIVFVLHDLMMLRRICTRGIFMRDGRIVNDGPIDSACDYYLETVGEKKGIAIAQKGRLGIVFNNGKLFIRWDSASLTVPAYGLGTMTVAGKKYAASSASWEITGVRGENEIIAVGRWPDIPVCQQVRIKLSSEKDLSLQIHAHMPQNTLIQKYDTLIIFSSVYKKWFTLYKEKSFPQHFLHPEEWDCEPLKELPGGILGLEASGGKKSLPAIVMDYFDGQRILNLGNTGSEIGGRVVVCEKTDFIPTFENGHLVSECFSGTLRLFDGTEDLSAQDLIFQRRTLLENSKSISLGPISIICEDHVLGIRWQGKLLTSGLGINTKFRYADKVYSATEAHWSIEKLSEKEIIVILTWDEKPPFDFIWRLSFKDYNTLILSVQMESRERIRLRNRETGLMLNRDYATWLTSDAQGDFKRLERGGSVVLSRYLHAQVGVKGIFQDNSQVFPSVIFSYYGQINRIAYLSKTKESVCLRYLEIDSQENQYIDPGRYDWFEGSICVSEKEPVIESFLAPGIDTKKLNRMVLGFDHGKGKIFLNDRELTKGLGLYTTVLHNNFWIDSSQAMWRLKESDSKRIVVQGRWPWLALIQDWELEVQDEKTILWKVKSELLEEESIERWQASCMFQDVYNEWFVPHVSCGKFPDKFREHRGLFWERVWYGFSPSLGIGAHGVPKIMVSHADSHPEYSYAIENTDDLFAARVLHCEFVPDANADGSKLNFEGKIIISS